MAVCCGLLCVRVWMAWRDHLAPLDVACAALHNGRHTGATRVPEHGGT